MLISRLSSTLVTFMCASAFDLPTNINDAQKCVQEKFDNLLFKLNLASSPFGDDFFPDSPRDQLYREATDLLEVFNDYLRKKNIDVNAEDQKFVGKPTSDQETYIKDRTKTRSTVLDWLKAQRAYLKWIILASEKVKNSLEFPAKSVAPAPPKWWRAIDELKR